MNKRAAQLKWRRTMCGFAAVSVFLAAMCVYAQYGFDGLLMRDDAVFAYAGQQLAQGITPYESIFQPKTPLSVFYAGLGAGLAPYLGVDTLLGIRYAFFLFSSFTVAAVFLLATRLFSSIKMGLLSAFVFLGYWGFGRHAASGPRAKTLAVGLAVVTLWLIARRNWFWAGLVGSLAFLSWQPMIVYPAIVIALALLQSANRQERIQNSFRAVAGFAAPILTVLVYFWLKDASHLLFSDAIEFPLRFLEREIVTLGERFGRLVNVALDGYPVYGLAIVIGVGAVWMIFVWRVREDGSFGRFVRRDPFAGFLLSWPLPFAWSLLDFQGYPDFFVFLPYAAIGFAWVLVLSIEAARVQLNVQDRGINIVYAVLVLVLVFIAANKYGRNSENQLVEQRRWASTIASQYLAEPTAELVTFGKPEALVLLERRNVNRHIVINTGEHRFIEAQSGLSIEEWVADQMRVEPAVVIMGPVRPLAIRQKITEWLAAHGYEETNVGNWNVFVQELP